MLPPGGRNWQLISPHSLSIMTLSKDIQGNVTQQNNDQHFVMMIAAFFIVMLCTIMPSVTLQSVTMLVTILS
jgi:hypothetical protein